jgi:hypothetical protein
LKFASPAYAFNVSNIMLIRCSIDGAAELHLFLVPVTGTATAARAAALRALAAIALIERVAFELEFAFIHYKV